MSVVVTMAKAGACTEVVLNSLAGVRVCLWTASVAIVVVLLSTLKVVVTI